MADEVELAIVTMRFDAADPGALAAVLSKYVVLTRMAGGCRNVDLCASVRACGALPRDREVGHARRAQRRHMDSDEMVEMATACAGILAGPPVIELWDGASAHDLA